MSFEVLETSFEVLETGFETLKTGFEADLAWVSPAMDFFSSNFCIFLKLMICHIVIGCCKRISLHQDLITGALINIMVLNYNKSTTAKNIYIQTLFDSIHHK
jgi:hypothetical protein